MIFIQRSVCLAILFNCATNQQLQPKKEGKLGRAKLLKQRAWIHSQTKHTLKVLRMGTTFFLLSNPQKLATLIVTFASTNTPATFIPNQREREKKDVCNIYVYIWVYIDIYACMHKRISIHIYTYICIDNFLQERERDREKVKVWFLWSWEEICLASKSWIAETILWFTSKSTCWNRFGKNFVQKC